MGNDYKYASRVQALEIALKSREFGDEDMPLIVEAYDLARVLDGLVMGRDPESGRLDLIRLSKRYQEVIWSLGLGTVAQKTKTKPGQEIGADDANNGSAGLYVVDPLSNMIKEAGLG